MHEEVNFAYNIYRHQYVQHPGPLRIPFSSFILPSTRLGNQGNQPIIDYTQSLTYWLFRSALYKRDFSRTVSIEFIGVFDTVSAVGALFPRTLPFSADNHITRTFRHALSLDEHRAAFMPQPWERSIDPPGSTSADGGVTEGDLGRKHVGIVRTGLAQIGRAIGKLFSGRGSTVNGLPVVPPPQDGPCTDVKVSYSSVIPMCLRISML